MEESVCKDSGYLPCTKAKKGPLPMKMRALPQSFWQQPNTLTDIPPTTYCPPLEDPTEQSRGKVIGVANIELLFSLFHSVQSEDLIKIKQQPIVRRGRPRKPKSKSILKIKKEVDPYFTSATVPSIQIQKNDRTQEQEVLALISPESNKILNSDSYSEKLNDLVVNL